MRAKFIASCLLISQQLCVIIVCMKTGKDKLINSSPDILGGTPVFVGTRVPVQNLIDCLQAGDSIDLFLYDFPTVSREQVIAVLETAKEKILSPARVK